MVRVMKISELDNEELRLMTEEQVEVLSDEEYRERADRLGEDLLIPRELRN